MIISILILALIFGPTIIAETLMLIGRIAEYFQNLGNKK
jgi:hypothetical protein